MERVGVGFVGCGGVCRLRHLPGLQKIPGVEFAAVANRSRESSEEVAQEAGIAHAADSWEEVVQHPGVDAVVIGTWPYRHHEVSVAALRADKHVFCQARMAMDAEEAREMRDAARSSGRVAALCPVPFGLSVNATVLRLLREGQLGTVHLVLVRSFSDVNLDSKAMMSWRKDHRLSGLNVLTLGMYVEVIHRWFGTTREVMTAAQIFTQQRHDALGETVEVRIPDQVLLNTVTQKHVAVQYAISGMVPVAGDSIEIYGSKASLYYDVTNDLLYWQKDRERREPVAIAPEDHYDVVDWHVEEQFINAIRTGAPYHPDFEDGYRYMQVVEAAAESSRTGTLVRIAEL
ncbi:MAG: Gfo/Idh/MocA family oxidoreductase [Candidatus Hydrogenedentes bacterium]|nr:Gfo/Idh/MocA family oxidoreductase [Candidatus Hydrogenedentota bacterium]